MTTPLQVAKSQVVSDGKMHECMLCNAYKNSKAEGVTEHILFSHSQIVNLIVKAHKD